jgi:hypothetical protein
MKLLPIAIKSGALLAKLLNNHIVLDQVLPSSTVTDEFPDKQITIRQRRWQHDSKSVRLTYKTSQPVTHTGGTYDAISKCHTDISFRDNKWRMTPALSTGALDFDIYANYTGTTQYVAEVIRSIAENITPPTFQQWKERFINA